jgi:hypothetical protein
MGEGTWGALAGLVASLCCIGPSAAILLGLGSSSALFGLHVDQRLALAAGLALLGAGVALAVRRARRCALDARSGWRQVAVMLAAGALAYGALGILVPWAAAQSERATLAAQPGRAGVVPVAAGPGTLRQATLVVDKMDCPPCVSHLRALLARTPQVRQFSVVEGVEEVRLVYDSRKSDPAALLALVPPSYQAVLLADAPLP